MHDAFEAPAQVPFYVTFLAESVQHLLLYRNGAEYAMQNASYIEQRRAEKARMATGQAGSTPDLGDIASSSVIKGNLAKAVLTCADKSWGVDWIAASFQIKKKLLNACTSDRSQVILTAEDGKIHMDATVLADAGSGAQQATKWHYSFVPTLQADSDDDHDRSHDSEHLLLNCFQHLIENGKIARIGSADATLSLVSERIPCPSCTKNIRQFLELNSWIQLHLFYFHDTPGRGPGEFIDDCPDSRIYVVEKIALSSVIHVVPVEDNARRVLSERVVEQQKMFGGAPNQIMAAF